MLGALTQSWRGPLRRRGGGGAVYSGGKLSRGGPNLFKLEVPGLRLGC